MALKANVETLKERYQALGEVIDAITGEVDSLNAALEGLQRAGVAVAGQAPGNPTPGAGATPGEWTIGGEDYSPFAGLWAGNEYLPTNLHQRWRGLIDEVRRVRQRIGWTQADAARYLAGCIGRPFSGTTLSAWELHKCYPSVGRARHVPGLLRQMRRVGGMPA